MDTPAGQAPDQPGIDCPGEDFPPLRPLPGARRFQDPGDLGGGEIGIDQQAGDLGDPGLGPALPQPFAHVGGTPVLPDDSGVDRPSTRLLPQDHRLALVGDPDPGDVGQFATGLGNGFGQDLDGAAEYLLRVVFHPAIFRIALSQGARRLTQRSAAKVE